ncbi:hypothetical protein GHO40_19140 [Pseudomonas helleri]|uniref:Uncharacterized protein n=1 Tax=Pseudomonas helleri TaxID=1608996 RepID=A0A7X1WCN3_9PSED|nr:hypothetical protein [Pseudomonas helleri]MQT48823.1 hypothetical protein [Pseudomonas helleri]
MEDILNISCDCSNFIYMITSTVIGGVIGFFSAWYISRSTAINLAKSKFRAAIAPEILRLKRDFPDKSFGDAISINYPLRKELKSKVEIYSQIIEEYRPHVPFYYSKIYDQKAHVLFSCINMGLGDVSHLEALLDCAKP